MDHVALIDKLLLQNDRAGGGGLDTVDGLKQYLADMLDEYFSIYYEAHLRYDRVDLPEAYVQFLLRSNRETVQFNSFGMILFGWPGMLLHTMYWAQLYKGEEQERYWISIGERGDKHFLFLCCDKKSPLFGTVAEFHDATPWIKNYPLPDSPEKDDHEVYGTFTQLAEHILAP